MSRYYSDLQHPNPTSRQILLITASKAMSSIKYHKYSSKTLLHTQKKSERVPQHFLAAQHSGLYHHSRPEKCRRDTT